jgi:drug/metabolite transporter (DMT)-like permease
VSDVRSSRALRGLLLGALGVFTFSFTLPFTRVAVAEIPAPAVGFGRMVIPGVFGALYLHLSDAALPRGRTWLRLLVVTSGIGFGFPLFTALALRTVPASHAAVVVGFNAITTAVAAVLLGRERPSAAFWLVSAAGFVAVLVYGWTQGASDVRLGDAYLLVAVVMVGIAYAEGGYLAREMPSFQVLCWALVLAMPIAIPVSLLSWAGGSHTASARALGAFGYVSLVSQFLGLYVWYVGLSLGGVARVGQIQLAQPLLTLVWSALLLGERIVWPTVASATAVMLCGLASLRIRVGQR